MTSQRLETPKPSVSWTSVHEVNDTLEGTVVGREEHTSKQTDQPFTILELVTDDNQMYEIVCGRADLRKFIDQRGPRNGDRIAVTYWGERGSRFCYTSAIRKAPDNQVNLTSDAVAPPPDEYAE